MEYLIADDAELKEQVLFGDVFSLSVDAQSTLAGPSTVWLPYVADVMR